MHVHFLPTARITVTEDCADRTSVRGNSDKVSLFALKKGILVLFIELPLDILKITICPKFIYLRMSNGQ